MESSLFRLAANLLQPATGTVHCIAGQIENFVIIHSDLPNCDSCCDLLTTSVNKALMTQIAFLNYKVTLLVMFLDDCKAVFCRTGCFRHELRRV